MSLCNNREENRFMALFKKKPKMTEEEKEQKLDALEERMTRSIKKLEGMKGVYFDGMMKARAKKLPNQEKQYRASLSRCIAQIHMQEGALMTLQLNRQNKEFSLNQADFMDSILMISKDIDFNMKQTNVKKVEDAMLKSKFALKKQEENLDRVLELDQYSSVEDVDSGRYAEYGSEIDGMIESYEGPSYNSNNYDKIKS